MSMSDIKSLLRGFNDQDLGSAELQATIAALQQRVEAADAHAGGSRRKERPIVIPVVKAVLAKLDLGQPGKQHAAELGSLLRLADACFSLCDKNIRQEEYHVLLYSYMKKLASGNQLSAAVKCSQKLLADLFGAEQREGSSRHGNNELLLGAGLNAIICTCKLQKGVLHLLHMVNQAAGAVLGVIS
jgi:hypothetical protein